MSGVSLAERVRLQIPTLAVIFATGHGAVDGIIQGQPVAVITNPFRQASLSKVVVPISRNDDRIRLGFY
jgi:FixJ family two-component response regulator